MPPSQCQPCELVIGRLGDPDRIHAREVSTIRGAKKNIAWMMELAKRGQRRSEARSLITPNRTSYILEDLTAPEIQATDTGVGLASNKINGVLLRDCAKYKRRDVTGREHVLALIGKWF